MIKHVNIGHSSHRLPFDGALLYRPPAISKSNFPQIFPNNPREARNLSVVGTVSYYSRSEVVASARAVSYEVLVVCLRFKKSGWTT